ncbi:HAMP domain-containing sensor histidine kinase [Asticcacaulis sp. AC402]|uniref:sensor histidine kinase n=1 Tax=Asticcacaulis sp. AC402 TaxID=1282361 RepID=UPI0003C40F72|nr:HAMP domain-containing sensor histidine kinase [Asticcacaulis sp. AC402]ESQ77547.1 histidine kinase [Asticcacaulis sp. AC402]
MSLPLPQSPETESWTQAQGEAPAWNLDPRRSPDKDIARKSFLRMVSHELRTPLNSIIGFSEILRQELYGPLGSPHYVEYANIIRDSGTKLLTLFNGFIEIVRLESGGDLKPVPEQVLPYLEEAAGKLKSVAQDRGVRLEVKLRDEDIYAMFDPRGLASCLDQLLHNAIDFTADGVVELDARCSGDQVDVWVFNRGDAPEQSDIERLMLPFEQGDGHVSRTREGAGLGWAIVKLNCQVMGGVFRVISRPGEGLKAIIRLKAA